MGTETTAPESRRSRQAAATRADIVDAATRLLLRDGYGPTSLGAIAAEAGVAVQTIYNSVGNKAEVLNAVLDQAAAGSTDPVLSAAAMRDRVGGAGTSAQLLGILADWILEVQVHTARVQQVIGQAAAVDAAVAEQDRRRAIRRLLTYGEAAAALRALRGLRAGLSDHEAAALIWAVGHPQVYRTLVLDVGWSPAVYRDWLEKSLRGALT